MNEVFAWLKAKSKGTKSAGVAGTTSIKWCVTPHQPEKHN